MVAGLEVLTALGGVDLAKAATKLISDAAKAVGPARESQDPVEVLFEIALDDELADVVRSSLIDLGFELTERRLAANPFDPSDSSERTLSIATRPPLDFYLICIPHWLLSDARQSNLAAFAFLSYTFPKNSIVYIISRDLPDMDYGFLGMVESWRVEKTVKAEFIPWPRIAKLIKAKDAKTRSALLTQIFRIQELEKHTGILSNSTPTEVSKTEQDDVIRILGNRAKDPFLPDVKGYFDDLVDRADFRELNQFVWQGMPENDARKLVTWAAETLKTYPLTHPKAEQTTLGWLITALVDQKLSPKDARTLANIVLMHALIRDQEKIKSLKLIALPSGPLQ